jgi:hypothetical protein
MGGKFATVNRLFYKKASFRLAEKTETYTRNRSLATLFPFGKTTTIKGEYNTHGTERKEA